MGKSGVREVDEGGERWKKRGGVVLLGRRVRAIRMTRERWLSGAASSEGEKAGGDIGAEEWALTHGE